MFIKTRCKCLDDDDNDDDESDDSLLLTVQIGVGSYEWLRAVNDVAVHSQRR